MAEPLITTVIPTYQRPAMLRQAVNSVRAQSWPQLAIMVCDNASGDGTAATVAELSRKDPRIVYHCHPENIGAQENFRFGVVAVRTPFCSILSDDDVLLPDFYRRALEAFREYPDAMFVAMPTLEADDSGRVLGGGGDYLRRYYRKGEAYEAMWEGSIPCIWTGIVFRREVFAEIAFLGAAAGPASDIAFLRHVFARFPGVVVPYLAAVLRVHPDSFSVAASPSIKMNRSFWDAQAACIENDEQVDPAIRRSVRRRIEEMYVRGLKRSVLSNLLDGRIDSAHEGLASLEQLGYPVAALLLGLTVTGCSIFPPLGLLVRRLAARRRDRQTRRIARTNLELESRREEFKALLECRAESCG